MDAAIEEEANGSGDLFRARLDQIINMRHEPMRLAGEIDWTWLNGELAGLFSGSAGGADALRGRAFYC